MSTGSSVRKILSHHRDSALRLLRKDKIIGRNFRGELTENVACYRTLCPAREDFCSRRQCLNKIEGQLVCQRSLAAPFATSALKVPPNCKNCFLAPCSRCGAERPLDADFFCTECGSILPPNKCKGYYELFKLDPNFDIDTKQLYEQYKSFQKKTHPDGFSRMSEADQLLAQQQSSFVNEAYTALRNPIRRAEYLLKCRGKPLPADGETVKVDPALLMEVMEMREGVEDASTDGELQGLRDQAQAAVEECLESLSTCFAANDLDGAARAAVRLKYMTKVEEEISAREGYVAGSAASY